MSGYQLMSPPNGTGAVSQVDALLGRARASIWLEQPDEGFAAAARAKQLADEQGDAERVPAAIALGRYVSSQLFGIEPNDPWMAVATMAVLTVVSAAAGLIPARRASQIDPILALRYE